MQKLMGALLFLLTTLGHAQDLCTLSGTITDVQDRPIAIGDVLLTSMENDGPTKYATLLDGKFALENLPFGNYRLQVSCLGFEQVEKTLKLDGDRILSLKLLENTTNLEGVEVIAAKPIVTNENGNLKIDVANPFLSSIADPMELLSRLPNIQVGADRESIRMVGRGAPLIYVGNQRISLEEFKAMSVSEIETIEIVRNPSAKYEADGRGVLLITRKTNDSDGLELSLSETLSFKRNFNNYLGFNGSFKKKRLTLKANVAYNDLLQWESHQFEFAIPEADVLSDYRILVDKNDRVERNSVGGLFYEINETDYFSANLTHRLQTNDALIATDTFLRRGTEEDDILSESDNENTKNFVSANLNYNKKISTGTTLFAGLQYSSFVQRLDTEIANNYNATQFKVSQQRRQRYRIQVLAYRLDVDKKLKNDLKWEFGANMVRANANALTNIAFLETNEVSEIDYGYSENTIAGFSMLSGKLGKKVNFTTGIRIENNAVKGAGEEERIPLVNRKNTNLFPRANVAIKIDSVKNVSLSYTKSIIRPNYSNASSIQVFFNPFLEGEGNVNLLPTLTEDVSLVYQFAKNSISVEYFKRKNPIYYTIGYLTGADRAVFSLKNLEKESGINLNLNVPITKGIWTSSNTISLAVQRIQDTLAVATPSKPYLYLYTDNQIKIGKKTTLSFGGWAVTERSEGIFERNAMMVLNAGITKTFFKKFDCAVRFNDITRAMNFEERYTIKGVMAEGVYFVDGQEVAFSIKYRFGKNKAPNYKNENADENLDRIR